MAESSNPKTSSADAVWPLKEIIFPPRSDRRVKVVYQRRNGPCSLLAICNILILRGDIVIEPAGRKSASYEYLASLVADFLVNRSGDDAADLTAALAVLPTTQAGMDLNPQFTALSAFRPEGSGGELKLFELCNILLVHGWLVDPQSPEYEVVSKAGDYDSALNLIVAGEDSSHVDPSSPNSDPEKRDTALRDALVLRQFLDHNSTQLTFHGLWALFSLDQGLYALIRNSHLSVLHKHHPDDKDGSPSLWTLVTDSNLVPEPSIVWESLEDIDGAASRFVDSHFFPSSTLGGDYSGHIPEEARERTADEQQEFDNESASFPPLPTPIGRETEHLPSCSVLLAQQLQAQEDELARQLEESHITENATPTPQDTQRPMRLPPPPDQMPPEGDSHFATPHPPSVVIPRSQRAPQQPTPQQKKSSATSVPGKKKNKDCIIM